MSFRSDDAADRSVSRKHRHRQTLSLVLITSSASRWNSSTLSESSCGSSSRDPIPKERRNCSVVPKSSGLPGASLRPTSYTRSKLTSRLMAKSLFTPLMFSTARRVTGCRNAMMDRVSIRVSDRVSFFGAFAIRTSQG